MTAVMRQVYSSSVSEIGYDDAKHDLIVIWARGGKRSVYENVPEDLADQVMNAPSVGQALREQIQGHYEHRYG